MARLRSWIVQEGRMTSGLDVDGKPCAIVTIRIRRWHPYTWWLVAKAVWKRATA